MANNYFETIPVVVFTREKLINDLYTYVNYEKIERELEETGAGSIKENKEFYAHRIASSIKALAPEATSAEELAEKLKSVL